MVPIERANELLAAGLRITLKEEETSEEVLGRLQALLGKYHGECPVTLSLENGEEPPTRIQVGREFYVEPSKHLERDLEEFLKSGSFSFQPVKELRRELHIKNVADGSHANSMEVGGEEIPF